MARRKKNESKAVTVMLSENASDMVTMQLVDIKFYPDMSDETLAFNARLKVIMNGECFHADCRNRGCGGCTDISIYDGTIEDAKRWRGYISMIDDWFRTQDDLEFVETAKRYGWKYTAIPKQTLEEKVNHMLAEWCDENGL